MASTDRWGWLLKAEDDDTLFALEQLCAVNDELPELVEMMQGVMKIRAMLAIHRMRLMGCHISRMQKAFLVQPPSWGRTTGKD